MKNVSIVSATGHYENTVKYLKEKHQDDVNYLIIYMYKNGVVPEKILTSDSALFWDKVFIFEPERFGTSGMNSVSLNKTTAKFREFITENDLKDADNVFMGVLPVLPMYNYIPKMFKDSNINLVEDGTASYMLSDKKLFEYIGAPDHRNIKRNKTLIKKKINRKENGLMLINTMFYGLFGNNGLARLQYKEKWNKSFKFNKIILENTDLLIEGKHIQFTEKEQFDFNNSIKQSEVIASELDIPVYFDQEFGVPAEQHVQILDKIFTDRGIEEIIIKLHPKSRQNYIDAFAEQGLNTKFIIELENISGEDYIRQACPPKVYGLNSTVLLNAKDVVAIELILDDYFALLDRSIIESNYYRFMFMNHSSYNLQKIINPGTEHFYKLRCRKSVLAGLRKPFVNEEAEVDSSLNSAYVNKLEKGVKNYMIGAMKIDIDEKQIFFEAYKGMYACSPKELYLYMKKQPEFADYTFVWARSLEMDINSQLELSSDERTILVNVGTQEYFNQLAKSKVIITNQRLHLKFLKKEGQTVIQTWHGTPFKRDAMSLNVSTHNQNHERRLEVNHHDVRNYDYFLTQNPFSVVELAKSFMLEDYPEVKVLESGYPRNTRLVEEISSQQIDELKDKYGIPKDKKVLFYTPTWRDHHKKNKAGISAIFDFDKWREELSDEWIILFRGHYFQAKEVNLEQYQGFIYDTTDYNDINDFYLMADLLVTDYSSSFFDYLNLKRPILFYMPDFVAYIKLSRKLHFEPETDLPGHVTLEIDDFLNDVKNYEQVSAPYVSKYDQYIEEFCPWDKSANQNVINTLKEDNILN